MNTGISAINAEVQQASAFVPPLLNEINKVVVGQKYLVERLIIGLLANGHVLLEGVPGLAKTLSVKSLAAALHVRFSRLQFTPDMLPADVIGTQIYNPQSGAFTTRRGPIFANLVLADEINRAPAKVQSALLEAMQERQVTIGRDTHELPDPFLVMATQNPIESDGTYPLPEAQVDRFMLKVLVDYPSPTEEFVIVERMVGAVDAVQSVIGTAELSALQAATQDVYVDPALIEYAVRVATATRDLASVNLKDLARFVSYGASPRASINMILAGQALALIRGRDYALASDVTAVAADVLRHRLVLSYEALAEDVMPDHIIGRVLQAI